MLLLEMPLFFLSHFYQNKTMVLPEILSKEKWKRNYWDLSFSFMAFLLLCKTCLAALMLYSVTKVAVSDLINIK